jgi:hypothetical protein
MDQNPTKKTKGIVAETQPQKSANAQRPDFSGEGSYLKEFWVRLNKILTARFFKFGKHNITGYDFLFCVFVLFNFSMAFLYISQIQETAELQSTFVNQTQQIKDLKELFASQSEQIDKAAESNKKLLDVLLQKKRSK